MRRGANTALIVERRGNDTRTGRFPTTRPIPSMTDSLDLKQVYTPHPAWSTDRIMPDGFLPMLPTPASGPLESADHHYEVKWEGLRVLAGLAGAQLSMRTGSGQDVGPWFPEMCALRAALHPAWVLVDGELVVPQGGTSSLPRLQQRLAAGDLEAAARDAETEPAVFMIFDVLRIGDSWLLDVNWEERRDILTRVVAPSPVVRLSPVAACGTEALAWSREAGLESVIAKRLRGRYIPGERTRDWLSIKPMEVVEAVICGWTEGRGARSGTIGTLLLGVQQGRRLTYIGHTGTGIDAGTLRTLHRDLVRLGRPGCPFSEPPHLNAEPHWVRPELVCRVRHAGWTDAGKMRAPTFMGMVDAASPTRL